MNRIVKVKCPYCGMVSNIKCDCLYDDMKVVLCDFMDGGCDKYFVADITVLIKTSGKKIQGDPDIER